MKKIVSLLGLLPILTAASCGAQQKSVSAAPTDNKDARLQFSLDLLAKVAESTPPQENIVVSPYSAGMALSMLTEGARGQTRAQLEKALRGAHYAGPALYADSVNIVSSANSVWVREGFNVKDAYSRLLEETYGAALRVRDFSDPATVGQINGWCAEQTHGRIPKIVSKIDPSMMMFLINALYFKGLWEDPFSRSATREETFHGVSGDKQVEMMHARRKYGFRELEGFQVVTLPYQGGRYTMMCVLPPKGVSPQQAMAYVDPAYFREAAQAAPEEVALSLPKFKMNTAMVLNQVLKAMGAELPFSGSADFGDITSASVMVDQVLQKCFLEVNEEGAEAAAVTSISVGLTAVAPSEPVVVRFDRPFLFALYANRESEILFEGIIQNIP